MLPNRKQITRLFPLLDQSSPAITVQVEPTQSLRLNTFYGYDELNGGFSVVEGKSCHSEPNILPNGFYFSGTTVNNNKNYALTYLLHHIPESYYLDEELDTSIAANIFDGNGVKEFIAANKAKNALYLYSLRSKFNDNNRPYLLCTAPDGCTGTQVYRSPTDLIKTIAGNLSNNRLAILFDSGEIHIVRVSNRVILKTVIPADGNANKQLFTSSKDLVIVHDELNKKLHFFDITQFECPKRSINCPKLTNIKITLDGKYLTALEPEENEAPRVAHYLNLETLNETIFKLERHIDDFAIVNDQVFVADNKPFPAENPNMIESMSNIVRHLGPIEKLLNPEKKSEFAFPSLDNIYGFIKNLTGQTIPEPKQPECQQGPKL